MKIRVLAAFAVFSSILLCAGCAVGSKYDRRIVKDSDGNIYELKHNIGDTYFIRAIDTNQLQVKF